MAEALVSPGQVLGTLRVIWIGFLVAVGIYAAVAHVVLEDVAPAADAHLVGTLRWVFGLVAVGLLYLHRPALWPAGQPAGGSGGPGTGR